MKLLSIIIACTLLSVQAYAFPKTGWTLNQCIEEMGPPDHYTLDYSPIRQFGACDHLIWDSAIEEIALAHFHVEVWILRQKFRCTNGVILQQGTVVYKEALH
jgi:hypothetical protein